MLPLKNKQQNKTIMENLITAIKNDFTYNEGEYYFSFNSYEVTSTIQEGLSMFTLVYCDNEVLEGSEANEIKDVLLKLSNDGYFEKEANEEAETAQYEMHNEL